MKIREYLEKRKYSFILYSIFYILLLLSLIIKSSILTNLYPVSLILVSIIFFISQYFDFDYRFFIIKSLILLISCPFLLVFKKEEIAECFANYAYGFLVLVLYIFVEKDYIKTIPTEVKEIYMITFKKEEYYSFNEEVLVNSEVLRGGILMYIDTPKHGDNISGVFKLEGWAAEPWCYRKDSVIDKIEVFLDGGPLNGIFIDSTELKLLREEVGEMYGEQFENCGFRLFIDSQKFENGIHTIYVYANSSYFGCDFVDFNIYINN